MKITTFQKHRPADRSDPGFTIPGLTLRWVSGAVTEGNPGRPWIVLRKADLPKELVSHIESSNPAAFSQGDTIRRGDLVLACATKEIADAHKAEIRQAARELEETVKRPPSILDRHGRNRASVEINEDEDVTEQMVARFKKDRNET